MVMHHRTYWRLLSNSGTSFLGIGALFTVCAVMVASLAFAQVDTQVSGQGFLPTIPPSPRLDNNLQYWDSQGKATDASSETPYVGEEGIPVMAETVVEGSVIDSMNDPFDEGIQAEAKDPWESFNSEIFQFNYNLDHYFMKPVAKGYNVVVPPDLQVSLDNAFNNLGFMSRFLNSLVQGKLDRAGIEAKRFLINTTMGVGGLFDVAKYVFDTEAPPSEDTGQTLAVYGMDSGPFLMLPFLPPLTVRDAVGYAGDIVLNPVNYFIPLLPNLGINVEDTINNRALNISTFEGIEKSTVDLYGAVRSGYLQRRAKDISQ